MQKLYVVNLTDEEHTTLRELVRKGTVSARKLTRAHILLQAHDAASDQTIADALHIGRATVERVRKRFVEGNLERALHDAKRPGGKRKLDGKQEALLVATACSTPPQGRARWTMQLLADKLVTLTDLESLSDETVRRTLKKNELKPWQVEEWCLPTVSAEFVCHMEDILELYAEEYIADYPVVCFDESPYQMISETRPSVEAEPGQVERIDYEYKREGTCNLFLMFQPLQSWRHVSVTAQRTKLDFAEQMRELVDVHFPQAKLISVVLDNLNTHTGGALYEAFEPAEARRILSKLEFRYTPKHGSWLNMAECEFAVLGRECLDRRLGSQQLVAREIAAWEQARNEAKGTVNWRFTTEAARKKLRRLYPSKS